MNASIIIQYTLQEVPSHKSCIVKLSVFIQLRISLHFSTVLTDKTYIIANISYITTGTIDNSFHIPYRRKRSVCGTALVFT